MKYRVLRPEYRNTMKKTESGQYIFEVIAWTTLGIVEGRNAMADAKKFHPTPVLERI